MYWFSVLGHYKLSVFQSPAPLIPLRSIWDGFEVLGYCDEQNTFYLRQHKLRWEKFGPCTKEFNADWKALVDAIGV